MLASPEFLHKSENLKQFGLFPEWTPPLRIARGYADLGYEEFLLLPENNIISLVNGKASKLPSEHRHLFFRVPSIQEMVDELDRRGFDIDSVHYEDQRTWLVSVRIATSESMIAAKHFEIECAFADVLQHVMEKN